jgi:hypothetical protein
MAQKVDKVKLATVQAGRKSCGPTGRVGGSNPTNYRQFREFPNRQCRESRLGEEWIMERREGEGKLVEEEGQGRRLRRNK